jgi:hypothetical protein
LGQRVSEYEQPGLENRQREVAKQPTDTENSIDLNERETAANIEANLACHGILKERTTVASIET